MPQHLCNRLPALFPPDFQTPATLKVQLCQLAKIQYYSLHWGYSVSYLTTIWRYVSLKRTCSVHIQNNFTSNIWNKAGKDKWIYMLCLRCAGCRAKHHTSPCLGRWIWGLTCQTHLHLKWLLPQQIASGVAKGQRTLTYYSNANEAAEYAGSENLQSNQRYWARGERMGKWLNVWMQGPTRQNGNYKNNQYLSR